TGPVTAKGVEDTAFYRHYPLASLCEVGGDPSHFGVSLEHFHRRNAERFTRWPHALLATSTHDTKRSEDVRARINVLSEIPARWYRALRRWQRLNQSHKTQLDHIAVPSHNEEYLIYQTLLGTWPFEVFSEEIRQNYLQRMQEYFVKALREAKTNSSWINPNEEYEHAVANFLTGILSSDGFIHDLTEFQQVTAHAGMWNSLAQTLLKITVPGVPDFYQGTELWNFTLVDPDNRQPVDYEPRQQLLASLRNAEDQDGKPLAVELLNHATDGRLKLYLTYRALHFRRTHRAIFEQGRYLSLSAVGTRALQAISFARCIQQQTIIVVATRFLANLPIDISLPVGNAVWQDTVLLLPEEIAGCYRDVFTGQKICVQKQADTYVLPLAKVCTYLPIALLEKTA
ncbi:MAG TPA: malto-oligosyltrehalose synthase, partial [Pseudomonadales bacterium]|nr:malto-oligosyltrehalose synthase [Pseudomonadales bacterium]